MPDNLKHLLHQTSWHHPQLCTRRNLDLARDTPALDKNGDAADPCPLEHLLTPFKRKPMTRKTAVVSVGQGPKKFKLWAAFASLGEASSEGCRPLKNVPKNDDFNAGSIVASMEQMWVCTGGQGE